MALVGQISEGIGCGRGCALVRGKHPKDRRLSTMAKQTFEYF